MPNELVAIWTRQYVRPTDIGDRIHMTDERMTKLVNDSYAAGHKAGQRADRYKLRQALDAAGVDLSKVEWPELPM
jgi:hypothetical protein